MAFEEDEESLEQTLLVVREVHVYKIPPRQGSGGYKCAEWLVSDRIWSGRMRVISHGHKCEIRLEDNNTGELFAACPVQAGKREASVESVTDSSRYFVLRISDGAGKHAFIGVGFNERNEAFDFNVALSDQEKWTLRETERADEPEEAPAASPAANLKLKEGETIRISVKTNKPERAGMLSSAATSTTSSPLKMPAMKAPLAPPPGGGRIRGPVHSIPSTLSGKITPPSSRPGSAGLTAGSGGPQAKFTGDPFADLSQLDLSLPSTNSAPQPPQTKPAGWAAF
ncbi:hypothetical protein KFL_005330090 [Klebsormidium nitens]|uniref:NECAP PHear domain-containing protein n=1 Tax=Klebsormidium nitens TaxID=105231 RepID=A0A1Y1IF70_KLENI|nr:hypothetical protein KFL_005330090 [Klebsormidium nitens]|eukprot:GAQ89534.1 hypothetical protein KFL_005330090 [Klebsormidium nitens]